MTSARYIRKTIAPSLWRCNGFFQLFLYLPSSQDTDTPKASERAQSSISDTGLFCPSKSDSAGTLISTPAVCSRARSSTCFIPRFMRASVTRAPTMFLSPKAKRLVFKPPPPFNVKLYGEKGFTNLVLPNII